MVGVVLEPLLPTAVPSTVVVVGMPANSRRITSLVPGVLLIVAVTLGSVPPVILGAAQTSIPPLVPANANTLANVAAPALMAILETVTDDPGNTPTTIVFPVVVLLPNVPAIVLPTTVDPTTTVWARVIATAFNR